MTVQDKLFTDATIEVVAWDSLDFAKQLLTAVRRVLDAAMKNPNLFDDPPVKLVVRGAAEALSHIEKRRDEVKRLMDAVGWSAYSELEWVHPDEVPELYGATRHLKQATDDAAKWLQWILVASEADERRLSERLHEIAESVGFVWHLEQAVDQLAQSKAIASLLVRRARERAGKHPPTPSPIALEDSGHTTKYADDSEDGRGREKQQAMRDGTPQPENAAAEVDEKALEAAGELQQLLDNLTARQQRIVTAIHGSRWQRRSDDDLAEFVDDDAEHPRKAVARQIREINARWKDSRRPYSISRSGRNPVWNAITRNGTEMFL